MKRSKRALLAAGLIAGAAAMTGCTVRTAPKATQAPAAQQETAQPQQTEAVTGETASPETDGEEAPARLALIAEDKPVDAGAIREEGRLFLPLMQTGEALGWAAHSESEEEETQTRRTVTLRKDDSQITVSWTSSDNTVRQITWQKDGLLIPVDARIKTLDGTAYVPAAFFEEAADAVISEGEDGVRITVRKSDSAAPEDEAAPENTGGQDETKAEENTAG